jgi:hypothetical protein
MLKSSSSQFFEIFVLEIKFERITVFFNCLIWNYLLSLTYLDYHNFSIFSAEEETLMSSYRLTTPSFYRTAESFWVVRLDFSGFRNKAMFTSGSRSTWSRPNSRLSALRRKGKHCYSWYTVCITKMTMNRYENKCHLSCCSIDLL